MFLCEVSLGIFMHYNSITFLNLEYFKLENWRIIILGLLEWPGNWRYFKYNSRTKIQRCNQLLLISVAAKPCWDFVQFWVSWVSLPCIPVNSPGKRPTLKIPGMWRDYKKFTRLMFSRRDVSLACQWTLQKWEKSILYLFGLFHFTESVHQKHTISCYKSEN